jgi:hypothetical protein
MSSQSVPKTVSDASHAKKDLLDVVGQEPIEFSVVFDERTPTRYFEGMGTLVEDSYYSRSFLTGVVDFINRSLFSPNVNGEVVEPKVFTVYTVNLDFVDFVRDDCRPGEFRLVDLRVSAALYDVRVVEHVVTRDKLGVLRRDEGRIAMSTRCNMSVAMDARGRHTRFDDSTLERMRRTIERCKDVNTTGSVFGEAPADLAVAELLLAYSVNQSMLLGNRKAGGGWTISFSMAMNLVSLTLLLLTFILTCMSSSITAKIVVPFQLLASTTGASLTWMALRPWLLLYLICVACAVRLVRAFIVLVDAGN